MECLDAWCRCARAETAHVRGYGQELCAERGLPVLPLSRAARFCAGRTRCHTAPTTELAHAHTDSCFRFLRACSTKTTGAQALRIGNCNAPAKRISSSLPRTCDRFNSNSITLMYAVSKCWGFVSMQLHWYSSNLLSQHLSGTPNFFPQFFLQFLEFANDASLQLSHL